MSGYIFPVLGGGPITSGLGQRRAPVSGASTNHAGIDIGGQRGTPILATSQQTVFRSYRSQSYGNVVYTRDASGLEHRYAHLDSRSVGVGAILGQGQQLGTLGSTGKSSGNHLHYEVRDKKGIVQNAAGLLKDAKNITKSGWFNKITRGIAAVASGGTSEIAYQAQEASGNIISDLKKWLKDSGFFQRIALALVAFILLFAAFYLLKSSVISGVVSKAKDAIT